MKYYLNDPSTGNLMGEVTDPMPHGLQVSVTNLDPNVVEFTTPQGLANNAYCVLCNGINMFNEDFKLSKWALVNNLTVNPMAGYEANAYYDRRSLKFFYFANNGKKIFTALSADVVSHELGHALLDAIRPDMFNAASMEVWAFHEAFGDINAIICALYHNEMVDFMLKETDNDIRKSNVVSRIGEEFGMGINLPLALREAANSHKYQNPASLPQSSADKSIIVREPHSFSKIMTGTFYDVLCSIFEKLGKDKNALLAARDYVKKTFYKACTTAPLAPNFYHSFCSSWIQEDAKLGGIHKDILYKVFQERNIIGMQAMSLEAGEPLPEVNVNQTKSYIKAGDLLADEIVAMADGDDISDMKVMLALDPKMMNPDALKMQEFGSDPIEEAKKAAKLLLDYILNKRLFGRSESDVWHKDQENHLARKMFQCDCYIPNYLFPGNPEYNKPYKPQNNSGCCTYGSCANTTTTEGKKIEKNCNLRYYNACRSTAYNGKC